MAAEFLLVPLRGARCIILDVPQPIGNHSASRDRPERVLARRGRYRLVRRGLAMVTLVGPANVRVHLSLACSRAVCLQPKTLGLRVLMLASRKGPLAAKVMLEASFSGRAGSEQKPSAERRRRRLQHLARLRQKRRRAQAVPPAPRLQRIPERRPIAKPVLTRARMTRVRQRRARRPASHAARQCASGDSDGPGSDPPSLTSSCPAPAPSRIVQCADPATRRLILRGSAKC